MQKYLPENSTQKVQAKDNQKTNKAMINKVH